MLFSILIKQLFLKNMVPIMCYKSILIPVYLICLIKCYSWNALIQDKVVNYNNLSTNMVIDIVHLTSGMDFANQVFTTSFSVNACVLICFC